MNEQIADYVHQNRDRYTREAITSQLIAAGHDPADIETTWAELESGLSARTDRTMTWGQWWLLVIGLVAVGAVAASVVWAGVPYTYGLVVPAYLVVVGLTMALAAGITYDRRKQRAVPTLRTLVIPPVLLWALVTGTCLAWGVAS